MDYPDAMEDPASSFDLSGGALIEAVRSALGRFPTYVRVRGAEYFHRRRVGTLEREPDAIRATVHGTHPYRSSWSLNDGQALPRCSCPVGPWCKHAYALALAALAQEPGDRRGLGAFAEREGQARLAAELEQWAHRRTMAPSRALRVVLGLEGRDEGPGVLLEVRVTTPRLKDQPRSLPQLQQMAYEAQGGRGSLSPPQARLARLLAERLWGLPQRHGRAFEASVLALNQLLDSFPDSPFVTWGEVLDPDLARRAGIVAGARSRLAEAAVDVSPVCEVNGASLRISLAVRWPDGRQRSLDESVYLQSLDDLHPSLVLASGEFWRVAEEPPRDLLLRMAGEGVVEVPVEGRERFLELLAASFESVAEALAPFTKVHRVHPIVAMDLRANDWLSLRVYAATDPAWRPGDVAEGVVVFVLDEDGQWERMPASAESPEGYETIAPGWAPESALGGRVEGRWLLERPDPESVRGAREWVASLPLAAGRGVRARDRASAPGTAVRITARTLEALAEAWERRPPEVTYLGNRRMRELLVGGVARPRVKLSASGVDWFAIRAEWEAEGRALTEADLARLRASNTRFVKLSSGWVRRERATEHDAAAEVLADLGIEMDGGEQRLSPWQLARAKPGSLAALEELGADPEAAAQIHRLRARVESFAGLPEVPVPDTFRGLLRPYQREGLDFLVYVTGLGLGAILADDMGLGKTVQVLAWIEHARRTEPDGGSVLVVCPASVVHNWIRESERFLPHLRVLALTSGHERHALRQETPQHDVVVTNYALLRRDLADWRRMRLRAVVLDEAQNIKNPDAAVSHGVRQLDCRHRLALTGTPLENRALDLWSIMQFVNPGFLGVRKAFVARYDSPDAPPYKRRLLAARLRPVLLRRLKSQVAMELPDRIEERRDCELTPGQRRLYLLELERGRALVAGLRTREEVQRHRMEILSVLTRLRQICCHPSLAGGKETLGSGKFDVLFELLEPLLAEGHKVLLFSQFVECLKLLATEMDARGVRHHMLTGATTRREQAVVAFESDPEPCVFLISLRAGGTGLNLTGATYVVLFDPWWNPAVEAQAIDRAHRIGQTRTVIAYRMLAMGTIEEKIWELQQRKAALANDVLGEAGFARKLDREDLQYLFADPAS
jgi:superfamily II DNA or RNA helicase